MNRRRLLFLAAALAALAVILAVSGGFRTTVGGLRISARSPLPIAFLAFINFTLWLSWARRAQAIESDLEAIWARLHRYLPIVAAIALIVGAVAAVFATRSAAGADASGYVSQADMWSRAEWTHISDVFDVEQDVGGWLTSPLGWRPIDWTDQEIGAQAPTYPPGLPLLMTIPEAIAGIDGAAAVVIVSAAVAVVATAVLAAQLGGGIAAVIAAVILGFTPIFLYQSIQPMSDVPVTAAWMVCFALLRRDGSLDLLAGIACAIAVMVRPNLAPLAIVPLFIAHRRAWFAAPVAIAGVFLALIQALWYGSPFRSGYGSAEELFAVSNILPNASRYLRWTLTTAPLMLLGALGFWRLRKDRIAQAMAVFALLVVASYLVYAVFDEWSYIRFLLPALAVLAIFAAAEISAWLATWPIAIRVPVLFVLLLGVTAYNLFTARTLDTFKLADQLARVETVGNYINANVPLEAVIVSGEQSGSMRYYTGRSILRWEVATPETLGKAVTALEQSGRPVFIVLDAWEDEPFRKRLSAYPAAALDWPPMVEAGRSHRTRLWKLSDRDRFMRGEPTNITRLP